MLKNTDIRLQTEVMMWGFYKYFDENESSWAIASDKHDNKAHSSGVALCFFGRMKHVLNENKNIGIPSFWLIFERQKDTLK